VAHHYSPSSSRSSFFRKDGIEIFLANTKIKNETTPSYCEWDTSVDEDMTSVCQLYAQSTVLAEDITPNFSHRKRRAHLSSHFLSVFMILSGAYPVCYGSSHYGHRLALPPAPAFFFHFPLSDQQPFIECPGLFSQPCHRCILCGLVVVAAGPFS